jgi:PAS domain S-box-containing protein
MGLPFGVRVALTDSLLLSVLALPLLYAVILRPVAALAARQAAASAEVRVQEQVTERKRAEKKLDERTPYLSALIENSPLAIVISDEQHRVQICSPAFERLFGYRQAEVLGAVLDDLIAPDELRDEASEFTRCVEAGRALNSCTRRSRKDGTLVDVEIHLLPLLMAGEKVGHLALYQDITQRKRAEEALRESEERTRLLLDSTAEAIYGVDLQGNCTFCNPATLRLLGYRHPDELLGKNMHALAHHTRPDGTVYPSEECRIYQAFRRGEGTHVVDEVLWRADGTSIPVEFWSYPVRRGGEVVGSVVTFVDITERKRAEGR